MTEMNLTIDTFLSLFVIDDKLAGAEMDAEVSWNVQMEQVFKILYVKYYTNINMFQLII